MKVTIISIAFLSMTLLSFAQNGQKKLSVEEYADKISAYWLGQCVGNIYGLPHECKYIDNPGPAIFPYGYKDSKGLKSANGAFTDDDTDIEYMYMLMMEKYGIEPSYEQLGETWKHHITGYAWLANRAAVAALHYGFTAPVTGMKAYNPHWFQIDPQLVNEIWGATAPGMINYAAKKSEWAAHLTDDSWGVEPTIHYGAMYSAAFFEKDVIKLIDIGLRALPANSRFATTVNDMMDLYRKYPNDWQKARKEMAEKYYINEPLESKTIWNANLNGACGILTLLYGQGDFQKTLDLGCAMGFDADNQAATMAGLVAVMHGTKCIPKALLFPYPELNWKEPFNDFYKNTTRTDLPDGHLKDMAIRTAKLGEKIILANGGKRITENGKDFYIINTNAEYKAHLELPKAPMPYIETEKILNYKFMVSGGSAPYKWIITKGTLPEGLKFNNGALEGITVKPGIYNIKIQVSDNRNKADREFTLVVRDKNLARSAVRILANVMKTNVKFRDSLWITVPRSLFSDNVEIIRDGITLGAGSTFYSMSSDTARRQDYYGYEWNTDQKIGLIGFSTGCMEEFGGWFSSLNAEYKDDKGDWVPVDNLTILPKFMKGNNDFKPHFVEYLLSFKPVNTKSIRIIGDAGGVSHWALKRAPHFTSITELTVHGYLPGFERLQISE